MKLQKEKTKKPYYPLKVKKREIKNEDIEQNEMKIKKNKSIAVICKFLSIKKYNPKI